MVAGWEGSRPCCPAPAMADSAASCAHCGKEGAGFKRCSVCKEAWYCGAACQKANWKGHKKTCAPPVTLHEVAVNVNAAVASGDWRGILKWEGRIEEMITSSLSDTHHEEILACFSKAHTTGWHQTGSKDHVRLFVALQERRLPLLGNLQRFRDQGEAMCTLADVLFLNERWVEGGRWYQRARDVGAAHGFFSVESKACRGLGVWATKEGRLEEGVALMRNAVVAGQLNELDHPSFEFEALDPLICTLFETDGIEEVDPLVLRFRELAKAQSEEAGGFSHAEARSFLFSARLHEVLRISTPSGNPFLLLGPCIQVDRIASVCHRFPHAREKTHALVEPCALPGAREA